MLIVSKIVDCKNCRDCFSLKLNDIAIVKNRDQNVVNVFRFIKVDF